MFDADFNFDSDDVNFGEFQPDAPPKRKIEEEPSNKKPCLPRQGSPTRMVRTRKIVKRPESPTRAVRTRKVVQRIFPGPAGLLAAHSEESHSWREYSLNKSVADIEILCSQRSAAAFSGAPWRRMLDDYQASGLPERYNIEWIKLNAKQKNLVGQKAPFLAAQIDSIECSYSSVTLFLRDPTGEMQCHIPCKLYKDYTKQLTVGSVIVLKQPAVLTLNFGQSHYLIITSSNLVQIYFKQQRNDVETINLVQIQDLFEKTRMESEQFDFKNCRAAVNEEIQVQSSQIVIKSENPAHDSILQNVFEGVDADSFFDDF